MAIISLGLGSFILLFISRCSICTASCEDGWIENAGRCYFVSSVETNWFGAAERCLLLDANLVDFEEEKGSLKKILDGVEAFRRTDLIPLWMDSNHLDSALCQIRYYHRTSKTFDSSRVGCDEKSYYICDKAITANRKESLWQYFDSNVDDFGDYEDWKNSNSHATEQIRTTKKSTPAIIDPQQLYDREQQNNNIDTDDEEDIHLEMVIICIILPIAIIAKILIILWRISIWRSALKRKRELTNVNTLPAVRPAAAATEEENQASEEDSTGSNRRPTIVFIISKNDDDRVPLTTGRQAAMESTGADSRVIYD